MRVLHTIMYGKLTQIGDLIDFYGFLRLLFRKDLWKIMYGHIVRIRNLTKFSCLIGFFRGNFISE